MPSPECDGAGGDQDHCLAALAHPSDVRREAFEPRAVETTLLRLAQQRGADLHDHALGVGQAVGARLAVFNVHGRQYCHLLSGAASPNMRRTNSHSSFKKDDLPWVESTSRPSVSGTRTWRTMRRSRFCASTRIRKSWKFNISMATSRSW